MEKKFTTTLLTNRFIIKEESILNGILVNTCVHVVEMREKVIQDALKEFGWIPPEQNKKLIEKINEDVIPEFIESKETYEEKGQYQQSQYYCDLANDLQLIISEIEGE